jgi:hypothetical protein
MARRESHWETIGEQSAGVLEMASLLSFIAFAAGANLLVNPSFDNGLDGWVQFSQNGATASASMEGGASARLMVPDSAPLGWPGVHQEFSVKFGQFVEACVDAMTHNASDGYGVYFAVNFINAKGERVSFEQSPAAPRDGAWTHLKLRAFVPSDAVKATLDLLLNAHGEAFFDNASFSITDQSPVEMPSGPATIEVTGENACESLIGFGAEDDGWFYSEENVAHGVTEEDAREREARIEWMDPDWVRMFFWRKDWNPSGDWETFDFDTPNMKSHYRTLDLYQRIGAQVNVTGVEWGAEKIYGDPGKSARAIGALFNYLIREKGYNCIRYWTLANEPNCDPQVKAYEFSRFVELHRAVKEEFARDNLQVKIVGSDDTDGVTWFEQCVKNDGYFNDADIFASHRYISFSSRELLPWFIDDRMRLLEDRSPVKPFVVAEFGFQDKRSGTLENPLMEEYRYAVWTASFAIDCLNRGVSGMCVWCLHEMYYPGGGFMNYGLWNFKDDQWKPRPVYHAWSMFTRLTESGDRVKRCVSSHSRLVKGAYVNRMFFWVNQSEWPVEIVVKGVELKETRVMTESTLLGERECGEVRTVENGCFSAPPMSFGYAR